MICCCFWKVSLVIIDEIHLLHDSRGPVLESIVNFFFKKGQIRLLFPLLNFNIPTYYPPLFLRLHELYAKSSRRASWCPSFLIFIPVFRFQVLEVGSLFPRRCALWVWAPLCPTTRSRFPFFLPHSFSGCGSVSAREAWQGLIFLWQQLPSSALATTVSKISHHLSLNLLFRRCEPFNKCTLSM